MDEAIAVPLLQNISTSSMADTAPPQVSVLLQVIYALSSRGGARPNSLPPALTSAPRPRLVRRQQPKGCFSCFGAKGSAFLSSVAGDVAGDAANDTLRKAGADGRSATS
jgi:hypothetical protein